MDRSVRLPNDISLHVVNIVEDVRRQHSRRSTAGNAASPDIKTNVSQKRPAKLMSWSAITVVALRRRSRCISLS